jgi:small conductance mechanosensitive channel
MSSSCRYSLAFWFFSFASGFAAAAITTANPDIPTEELRLRLTPLSVEELTGEADAWQALLKNKVEEVSEAEVAVMRMNLAIDKAQRASDAAQDTKEQMQEARSALEEAEATGTADAANEARAEVDETRQTLSETNKAVDQAVVASTRVASDKNVRDSLDGSASSEAETTSMVSILENAERTTEIVSETTSDIATGAPEENADADEPASDGVASPVADLGEELQERPAPQQELAEVAAIAEQIAEEQRQDKAEILTTLTQLRAERTALIDRLKLVLDELDSKLGPSVDGIEHEQVTPYLLYADAVSGITVDVTDTHATWISLYGWLVSPEGGIRWGKNFALFLLSVASFWLLGQLLGRALDKALRLTMSSAVLLREFIVSSTRRILLFIGIAIGLSALEINMGPIFAIIGAAGFVVAFALQNTLSNFASGIMIMFYRPFDIGDVVEVSGVTGVVKSMNLVNTTVTTFDNKIMIVPNNSIWGNIITNITGSERRRVDLVFGIGYDDDLHQAKAILQAIVAEHPAILENPAADIKVHELAESSVNFICRPWTRTGDYWTVYWDVTQAVKERFDQAGITIPYPQQSVHLAQSPGAETL